MLGVVFARLQLGINEGCLGERLGQKQIANASRFARNRLPKFLIEHFVAECANKRVRRRAGFLGLQSDFNMIVALRNEDVKKAAIFVGSLFYCTGLVESCIKGYNSTAIRQVIGRDTALGHLSETRCV